MSEDKGEPDGAREVEVWVDSIEMGVDSWTGEDVDGLVRLMEKVESTTFKHIIPFRTKGVDANTPKTDEKPYVWKWENPQDDNGHVTLHPSYKTRNIHVVIDQGKARHI